MEEISKQRTIGKKVCDTEYVYEMMKEKCDISLYMSDELDGYTISPPVPVVVGISQLGRMELYQDGLDGGLIFSLEYNAQKLSIASAKQSYTHWHPMDVSQAMKNVDDFFYNPQTVIDDLGLNIRL